MSELQKIFRSLLKNPLVQIYGWVQVAPEWERLTAHIEADPESKERLGWVREMYAFSTAVALKNIKLDIVACPECPLISQVGQQKCSCENAHCRLS